MPYCLDYKTHTSPQIWEEDGGASYSPNVAYLAHWGGGGEWRWSGFFSCFPPLKPRYILWPLCLIVQKIWFILTALKLHSAL